MLTIKKELQHSVQHPVGQVRYSWRPSKQNKIQSNLRHTLLYMTKDENYIKYVTELESGKSSSSSLK